MFGLDSENEETDLHEVTYQGIGLSRVGSTSLVENMGMMMIVLISMIVLILLTFLMYRVCKRSEKVKGCYRALMRKIFYNALIRYII